MLLRRTVRLLLLMFSALSHFSICDSEHGQIVLTDLPSPSEWVSRHRQIAPWWRVILSPKYHNHCYTAYTVALFLVSCKIAGLTPFLGAVISCKNPKLLLHAIEIEFCSVILTSQHIFKIKIWYGTLLSVTSIIHLFKR